MDKKKTIDLLSESRYRRYLKRCDENHEAALAYYAFNVRVAQASYVVLEAGEILLRNQIHRQLAKSHHKLNWYEDWLKDENYRHVHKKIKYAIQTIKKRKEQENADKVIAEMTLGFWVSIFNAEFERMHWKQLRLIFRNIPKNQRKRHTVSSALNRFRKFRNRVSHYEPITFDIRSLWANYKNILGIIDAIDHDYYNWVVSRCDLPSVIDQNIDKLKSMGVKDL